MCELRQIEVFHSWWAFCLLFSHKKVGIKRHEVNVNLVVKPNIFELSLQLQMKFYHNLKYFFLLMLKETKTTTQSKIPFLWLQARLPIHKREFSRIGWTPAARDFLAVPKPRTPAAREFALLKIFCLWFESLSMTKI